MDSEITFLFQPRNFDEIKLEFDCYFIKSTKQWKTSLQSGSNSFRASMPANFSRGVVKVDEKVFLCDILNLRPEVVEYLDDGTFSYFLNQYGMRIAEIGIQNSSSPLIIEILPDYTRCVQIKSLIEEVRRIGPEFKNEVLIDVVTDIYESAESDTFRTKGLKLHLSTWTVHFEKFIKDQTGGVLYYNPIDIEKCFKVEMKSLSLSSIEEISCVNESNGSVVTYPTLTFMRFVIKKQKIEPESRSDPHALPLLKHSFKHQLSKVGTKTLNMIEMKLAHSFSDWNKYDTGLIAPMISLCQSSGSGKSKMAFELIKKHLGFYIVFREPNSTGYPETNNLSKTFKLTVEKYNDQLSALDNLDYNSCTVGQILHFIAKVVTKTIQLAINSPEEESLEATVKRLGCRFEENDKLTELDCLAEDEEMHKLYTKTGTKTETIKVRQVSLYIQNLLNGAFVDKDASDKSKQLFTELSKFPFIFTLDEAELLAKFPATQPGQKRNISGLEIVRRAISYLEPSTKILFLTLGTKSNVIDLNPPVIDTSARYELRSQLPYPIILSSNLNIFSKEFPISSLKVTYKLLKNPHLFKYLCTLGHSIWCSKHYDSVLKLAEMKITNGSGKTHDYVLPIWMILTGFAANPLRQDAGKLVASNMAYLMNLSEDLKSLIVMYPSEPVLAMAANLLIDKLPRNELFAKLLEHLEAVELDRGAMAEVIGEMILLRSIHKSKPVDLKVDLNEICKLAPEFKDLWETEKHVLEDCKRTELRKRFESEEAKQQLSEDKFADLKAEHKASYASVPNNLEDYKIHMVRDFLLMLTGNVIDSVAYCIPSNVLNGIINANHFVNLNRCSGDISQLTRDKLPLADDRITDLSRNVLDESILRVALIRQCGLRMPPNYYGIDLVIPVCLEDDTVTFIGIQVKRSRANVKDDIFKMQSRFHFIKCINIECGGGSKTCAMCLDRAKLQNIYYNQVSILLSLDDEGTLSEFSQTPNESYFPGCDAKTKDLLKRHFIRNSSVADTLSKERDSLLSLPTTRKSDNFFEPLINMQLPLSGNVMLSCSLWDDKLVDIKKIPSKNFIEDGNKKMTRANMDFTGDNFIHRQFCVCIRGWDSFSGIFENVGGAAFFKETLSVAHELMDGTSLFKNLNKYNTNDLARKVVSDSAICFMEYSEELHTTRYGIDKSFIDKLDSLTLQSPPKQIGLPLNPSDDVEMIYQKKDEKEEDLIEENQHQTRSMTSKNFIKRPYNNDDQR